MNTVVPLADFVPGALGQEEVIRLGMAQLGPHGLSEQWLLRLCGDVHWSLIARAIGQARAVFRDDQGCDAYAAFCATSLEIAAPRERLLGADMAVSSDINRVGSGRIGSIHRMGSGGATLARVRMISTFVSHDETGLNRRIVRNRTADKASLPAAPAHLSALADDARATARAMADRPACGDPVLRQTPCPSLDFNAAGLLYFPTFSRLAESAQWAADGNLAPLARREIVYMGNLDVGDGVGVFDDHDGMCIHRSDGRMIAHIRTERHAALVR